jgi:hypothetical protein
MPTFTIRSLHLKPEHFGAYPDIVCQIVDLLAPNQHERFEGSQDTGFHWYELSSKHLAKIKETLIDVGATPEIEDVQLNFELYDWMQAEGVEEGYQLVVQDVFGIHMTAYRICSKQLQRASTSSIPHRDELFLKVLKGKTLDYKMWTGFCEFLEAEKFWDDVKWITESDFYVLDGVGYGFEGWKHTLTKFRYGANEPKFEKVIKFLDNLLKA